MAIPRQVSETQAYVAVSRVRTLTGLRFKEWPRGLHVSPEAIEFYQKG